MPSSRGQAYALCHRNTMSLSLCVTVLPPFLLLPTVLMPLAAIAGGCATPVRLRLACAFAGRTKRGTKLVEFASGVPGRNE